MSKYELAIIDADTPILRAAVVVQTNYVLVTNNESKKTVRFNNQTEFWGHWKKKAGGKLKEYNDIRLAQGKSIWTPEDFTLEECSELNTEIEGHLDKAIEQFDFFIGRLKKFGFAEDYLLGISGEGNFRYGSAQQLPYKGKRKDKPLLYTELKQAIAEKYQRKAEVVNGEEVDDWCAILGNENYQNYKRTNEWKYVIGFIDKDLKQIISPQFNYTLDTPEIIIPTEYEAAFAFCTQLLAGDIATDNIPGLPNFTAAVAEKYKMGKTRGIGMATAEKFLDGSETINELFARVAEAYQAWYGHEKKDFVTHTGNTVQWNWLDYLSDSAKLLRLRAYKGEDYNIADTFRKLGVYCG